MTDTPDANGWRDIASAPRDGTTILVYRPRFFESVTTAWWSDEFQGWTVGGVPSHWQPLPAPPVAPSSVEAA